MKTCEEALTYVKHLLEFLMDFSDKFNLQEALNNAQQTSIKSPFISTSMKRSVARTFATEKTGEGYIYTISGPSSEFYDFNKVRQDNGLPFHKTYHWMEELGIPIKVDNSFIIEKIEKIKEVKEEVEVVFEK